MIDVNPETLLMIEPSSAPSATPVNDRYTRKLEAAWAASHVASDYCYRGQHACTGRGCSAVSDNRDHAVAGYETHSLALHYLAYHREDVPASELEKIDTMTAPEVKTPFRRPISRKMNG